MALLFLVISQVINAWSHNDTNYADSKIISLNSMKLYRYVVILVLEVEQYESMCCFFVNIK